MVYLRVPLLVGQNQMVNGQPEMIILSWSESDGHSEMVSLGKSFQDGHSEMIIL